MAHTTTAGGPDVREEALNEQQVLVDLIEKEGWDVTETEISVYESPWKETGAPEATVTITARKPFPSENREGEGNGDKNGETRNDDDDDNPYRVN